MNKPSQKNQSNLIKKLVITQLIIGMLASFLLPAKVALATEPLMIYNISVVQTDKIATITWQTNRPAYGKLEYGLASDSYHWSLQTNQQKNETTMTISGLYADTNYFFKVTAWDSTSEVTSFERTFKTKKSSDNTAPTISRVQAAYTTGKTATIQWFTDEDATTEVSYGQTTSYGSEVKDSRLIKIHDITIAGLKEGTYYHFLVKSKDKDNNVSRFYDLTFQTKTTSKTDNDDLLIYEIQPTSENNINVTENSAVISWRTNKLTEGWIRYGTSASFDKTILTNPPRDFAYAVTLTNLESNRTYYFQIEAKDVLGKRKKSETYSFHTKDSTGLTQTTATGQILGSSYVEGYPTFYASYNSNFLPDIAGGAKEATQFGSVVLVPGQFGQGAEINSNSQLEYPGKNNFNINEGTIAFWFKPSWSSSDDKQHTLFDLNPNYKNSSNKYFIIAKTTNDDQGIKNELSFGLEDSDDNDYWAYLDDVQISAGQWYFVVATWKYNSSSYRLYLNGQSTNLKFSYKGDAKKEDLKRGPNLGEKFYVGSASSDNRTDAIIDEVMIFDYELGNEEIYRLYLEGTNFFKDNGGSQTYSNNGTVTGTVLGVSNMDQSGDQMAPAPTYACNPNLGYTKIKALYKTSDSPDIWAILETGQKHYITSPEAFNKYQCNWNLIKTVSKDLLGRYAYANLVRTPTDPAIYHLFQRPDYKWLKINIPSPTIFVSYATNFWGNVARIDALDINSYPNVKLIKATDKSDIYLIEGNQKRRFKSMEVFNRLGYDWAEVVELNQIHLDSFINGSVID